MTWDELIKAACEQADDSILENELYESYEFSKKHKARMKRLVRSVGRPQKISALWRTVAVAAICLCFLGAATGVYALGVRIAEWHSTVTDKGTNIVFEITDGKDVPRNIENEYELKALPKGFEQTDISKKTYKIETRFSDNNGGYIVFSQYCYGGFSGSYNTENAVAEEISVNGECGFYVESKNEKTVIWENGEYVFVLLVSKNFIKEEIIDMACNITVK